MFKSDCLLETPVDTHCQTCVAISRRNMGYDGILTFNHKYIIFRVFREARMWWAIFSLLGTFSVLPQILRRHKCLVLRVLLYIDMFLDC